MSEQAIEQEIQEKGLNAPRLTPSDIDAAIVGGNLHHATQRQGHGLRTDPAQWLHRATGGGYREQGQLQRGNRKKDFPRERQKQGVGTGGLPASGKARRLTVNALPHGGGSTA